MCRSSVLILTMQQIYEYGNERSLRWQHSIQQHIRFVFLVDEICSSLLHDVLQVISILLQLAQHAVHYVKFPTTGKY